MSTKVAWTVTALSFAFAMLGVGEGLYARDFLANFANIHEHLQLFAFTLFIASICVFVSTAIVWLIYGIRHTTNSLSDTAKRSRLLYLHEIHAAEQDVPTICSIGANSVGATNHADEATLLRRLSHNKKIIIKIVDTHDRNGKIRGYYIIYPLTKSAHNRVSCGDIPSGRHLRPTDLSKTYHRCYALYVAMIYGDDKWAKAKAVDGVYKFLKSSVLRNRSIKAIYARPATSAGLGLLNKNGFEPINSNIEGCIWKLDIEHSRLNAINFFSRHRT